MGNIVVSQSEQAGLYRQELSVAGHTLHADVSTAEGGGGSAPGPHDFFDAALASCKSLTAVWYAKRHQIPLERVEARVERDDSAERQGIYRLAVQMTFHGPLTDADRATLLRVCGACPIHKLMTQVEVQITTLAAT